MCIIVDANSAHHLANQTNDGKPVRKWLLNPKKRAGIVLGGKLTSELVKAGLRATLVELNRAGRLHRVPDDVLTRRIEQLDQENLCESNDVHVVALALITQCSLVFTHDKPLHADLKRHSSKDHKIKIYQTARHARSLTSCKCI